MTNVEGNPNEQVTNKLFGFRHSFVIRHLSFVI